MATKADTTPRLPDDVVIKIINTLGEVRDRHAHDVDMMTGEIRKTSQRAIGACKRVCHAWRDICTPIQWNAVAYSLKATITSVDFSGGSEAPLKKRNNKRRTLGKLAMYFRDHPDLAKHVTVLALESFGPADPEPFWYTWIEASDLAESLQYLPNLKDLHMVNMIMTLRDPSEFQQLAFPHLEQLTLRVWERGRTVAPLLGPSHLMYPLFLFPAIDQVMIFRHNWVSPDSPQPGIEHMRGELAKCKVRSFWFETGDLLLHKHLQNVSRIFNTGMMHTLDLSHVSAYPLPVHIAPILKQVGPTLKKFKIGFMAWHLLGEWCDHLAPGLLTDCGIFHSHKHYRREVCLAV